MSYPLYVAFVWHMHQPYYRAPGQMEALLPWVRLHAAKDYLHMAEVLEKYPTVHATFNMVPSLTEQLFDYAAGRLSDRVMSLAHRSTWTEQEKAYLVNICYSVNWPNIARRYPRYHELIEQRERALVNPLALSDADYRDLITWFNLAWTDPNWLENDPALRALVNKGRGFTVADTVTIIHKHLKMCGLVLERYRQLEASGQIELTTTPYYHPILPLLIDNRHAQRPTPDLPLPPLGYNFAAPADAEAQLRQALAHHTQHYGRPPRGLWPAEGAVSPEILPYVQAAGLRWLASDEEILARSLNIPLVRDYDKLITNPEVFYQPYRLLINGQPGPTMIFRDHEMSDRLGFLYQNIHGIQAADDLITRLQWVHWRLGDAQPFLLSIILDGENCWEWYEHNGDIFLNSLYQRLEQHSDLRAVTVNEYLEMHPTRAELPNLATGSWIRADLTTWIGDPEHTRAWSALARTRADLVAWQNSSSDIEPAQLARAWQALYISEGSDWFWWYSRNNSSDQDLLFDQTFRANMAVIYEVIGQPLPEWVVTPIAQGGRLLSSQQQPAAQITPALRAAADAAPDWNGAAIIQARAVSGAMQRADGRPGALQIIRVGYDDDTLFLRLELSSRAAATDVGVNLNIELPGRPPTVWGIRLMASETAARLHQKTSAGWQHIGAISTAIGERVVEVAAPLAVLGLTFGATIHVQADASDDHRHIVSLPPEGPQAIAFTVLSRQG